MSTKTTVVVHTKDFGVIKFPPDELHKIYDNFGEIGLSMGDGRFFECEKTLFETEYE